MKLIVGLGNPGVKYQFTRHNAGFLVIKRLAKEIEVGFSERKFNSRLAKGNLGGARITLIKPYTYMNLSGKAVLSLLKWTKLNLEDLLVVCDDLSLKFTSLRIKPRGSSAGHNGLKSIIDSLGTRDFPRLRLGIGGGCREDKIRGNLERYVLAQFTSREKRMLGEFVERATEACAVWANCGIEVAMRRFNARSG